MFRLIPRKQDNQYLSMNLSAENINTAPLRYRLHQSFTDKSEQVRSDVALEFETLAKVFDAHITHTEKEFFQKY